MNQAHSTHMKVRRSPHAALGTMAVEQVLGDVIPSLYGANPRMFRFRNWADEIDGSIEPRPHLEGFYTLIALQLGDPEVGAWLRDNSVAFRLAYGDYLEQVPSCPREDANEIMISYIFWYQRNRPA